MSEPQGLAAGVVEMVSLCFLIHQFKKVFVFAL